ncbi:glycosyltransferase family 4 protein [Acidocella aminolytica]|uniref:Glycosyl transferase n=1 Tax=Acidocella aminolytica 101 = DSM 11237 TaxID=1120923 RepID=A0A0D6PER7_9PROT|nr:glycosyltransferase family 4 protein [Acidocella aminolytica]GAN80245.1 hypothetical protein Aam_041_012 [Acidocella aminolytica 101 = DSM 11237]GBQ44621.1 hypothetical protein AA11237_3548 [Acidocella aminolytica 101 = DSM 11237]SHE92520.1 Glycosyl transferases group 1 [Acidocella aminolytica 101 = DSM 11237]
MRLLLTSARLSTPIERYDLARLAGPHITRIGQYAVAASPLTAGGYGAGRFYLEAEQRWCARHIAAIQPEEAALVSPMCPNTNIFIAPIPALPRPPPPGTAKLPGRLIFMGSDSLPTLDGLRCFFEEMWSALRGQGVSLDLVGDCGLAMRHLPPEVTLHGWVRDPALLLHSAFLAIAQLRARFGLKIKLLDYARHGLLTIATPPSLQGFAALAEAPFVIAGTRHIRRRHSASLDLPAPTG